MYRYRTLTERRRIKSNFRLTECASASLYRSVLSHRYFALFREINVVKCTVSKFTIARRTAVIANERRIISSDLSRDNRETQVSEFLGS